MELPHRPASPQTFARLGQLHRVVLVAYAVFRLGAEERIQLGEELVGRLFVHLGGTDHLRRPAVGDR
jgi:hypothetical protein